MIHRKFDLFIHKGIKASNENSIYILKDKLQKLVNCPQ